MYVCMYVCVYMYIYIYSQPMHRGAFLSQVCGFLPVFLFRIYTKKNTKKKQVMERGRRQREHDARAENATNWQDIEGRHIQAR